MENRCRIGVVSDVHGNLPALRATLDRLEEFDVDEVYCCGDMVGVLGWSGECVARLREECSKLVVGNHDKLVLDSSSIDPEKENHQLEYEQVRTDLTEEQLEWLDEIPESQTVGEAVKMVHSHPDPEVRWTGDDRVTPDRFPEMGSYTDGRVLLLGHTHEQHAVDISRFDGCKGAVLNPGAVGVPYYEAAEFAVLEVGGGEPPSWSLEEAPYDSEKVPDRLEERGMLGDLRRSLAHPRNRGPRKII